MHERLSRRGLQGSRPPYASCTAGCLCRRGNGVVPGPDEPPERGRPEPGCPEPWLYGAGLLSRRAQPVPDVTMLPPGLPCAVLSKRLLGQTTEIPSAPLPLAMLPLREFPDPRAKM